MDSLRECVACKDIKDTTYLLPCLHPTCSQCVEEIVQDAKQKNRKLPGCRDCGESFVQDKLTTVPSDNNSASECVECGIVGAYFCRDCNEYLCKSHGEPHPTTRRFKGHVVQLVVEVPFCNKHSSETAAGFCTHCKVLVCGNCSVTEHNKPPHLAVSFQEAVKATTDSVKKDVAKLLQSVPAIDNEIKKYIDIRTKLEKERAELEAKIANIRKQEKVTTLQIEDLEKTKALLLNTQTQTNTLASATLPHSTLLRLQSVITTRVSNLQTGLGMIVPIATFNRVFAKNLAISNNRKTIRNINHGDAYGISDDGCSSGVRSWRITINSITTTNHDIMFGIWNSTSAPASAHSYSEANAWLFNCYFGATYVYKAGSKTNLRCTSPLQSGDVILLTIDADQRCFNVQNTTRGWFGPRTAWSFKVDRLPPPNPAYYPHVVLYHQNSSVTIEAAS